MRTWPVRDAKARFSELLEACLEKGPQLVTRHGRDAAVLVPIEEWYRLWGTPVRTLKELMLTDDARGELAIPARGRHPRRPAPQFD
jgi:prevent-host-death family protein